MWVMDKVKEKTNNNMNPDQWAKIPFPDKYDAEPINPPDPIITEEEETK